MTRSILNERDRAEIVSRLRSLSASSAGRWGIMDVVGMLRHLWLSSRMTLGELLGGLCEQAGVPVVSAQALDSLRASVPEGSADCARVEAERCGVV